MLLCQSPFLLRGFCPVQFSGQVACAGHRHHAAGPAAGGDGLSAFDLVWIARRTWRTVAGMVRPFLSFRWTGAALAAGVMAFPLLVRPIRLSIEGLDRGLEEAARTLGANRFTAFFTVILPPLLPGILAGAVLGFAKALGEFGATITFVSNIPGETQTLSLAIYALMQTPTGDAEAFRLIAISAAISITAVILSEWLQRRLAGEAK